MSDTYAVIDIETTGGNFKRDRITEVGIVIMEDGEIIDTYESLVNPRISVPPFITRLTGIHDGMLIDAPEFHEIAKIIVEMTEGRIFVAHNVNFDYKFISMEFERLGYDYYCKTMCTARLSRQFFPEIPRHNLATLIKYFKIEVTDRHRALEDAKAAAIVLQKILTRNQEGLSQKTDHQLVRSSNVPRHMDELKIAQLPNSCGVYYMLDEKEEIVYIGKSKTIRSRIRSHFSARTEKAFKMRSMVHDVIFELTGNEMHAEIHESMEIRRHKPILNKAKRKTKFPYAVLPSTNNGFDILEIKVQSKLKKADEGQVLQYFSSRQVANAFIKSTCYELDICSCLMFPNKTTSCLKYPMGKCDGAALGHVDAEDHNAYFQEIFDGQNTLFSEDALIIGKGRKKSEKSLVLICAGQVSAFGFQDAEDEPIQTIEDAQTTLTGVMPLWELDSIAYKYLKTEDQYSIRVFKNK